MAERPKREKVLTAADLKRKADRDALKAAREGKKSRLDSLVVRGTGMPCGGCMRRYSEAAKGMDACTPDACMCIISLT